MMSDKPRGVIYTGVTSDLHGRIGNTATRSRRALRRNTEQRILSGLRTTRTSCWRSDERSL
ncbi:hypothetical protein [Rhizobium leguminosarum]